MLNWQSATGDQAKQNIASAVLMATTLAEHLTATEQAELLSDIVRLIQIASASDVSVALARLALRSGETEALRTYQDLLDEACGLEASIQSLRAAGVREESSSELSGSLARHERIDRRLDSLAAELDPALIADAETARQTSSIAVRISFSVSQERPSLTSIYGRGPSRSWRKTVILLIGMWRSLTATLNTLFRWCVKMGRWCM